MANLWSDEQKSHEATVEDKVATQTQNPFRTWTSFCKGIGTGKRNCMMKKVCSLKTKLFAQIEESYLSAEQKEQIEELISKRLDILSQIKGCSHCQKVSVVLY